MTTIAAPTSIDRALVLEFVRSLGIDPNMAVELRIGIDRVEVEMIALNEAGKPFAHPDHSMATHTISICMRHDEADQRDVGL